MNFNLQSIGKGKPKPDDSQMVYNFRDTPSRKSSQGTPPSSGSRRSTPASGNQHVSPVYEITGDDIPEEWLHDPPFTNPAVCKLLRFPWRSYFLTIF